MRRSDPPHFAVALWSSSDGIPMTIPSPITFDVMFRDCSPKRYDSGTLTCRMDEQTSVQPIVVRCPVVGSSDVPLKPSQHA